MPPHWHAQSHSCPVPGRGHVPPTCLPCPVFPDRRRWDGAAEAAPASAPPGGAGSPSGHRQRPGRRERRQPRLVIQLSAAVRAGRAALREAGLAPRLGAPAGSQPGRPARFDTETVRRCDPGQPPLSRRLPPRQGVPAGLGDLPLAPRRAELPQPPAPSRCAPHSAASARAGLGPRGGAREGGGSSQRCRLGPRGSRAAPWSPVSCSLAKGRQAPPPLKGKGGRRCSAFLIAPRHLGHCHPQALRLLPGDGRLGHDSGLRQAEHGNAARARPRGSRTRCCSSPTRAEGGVEGRAGCTFD